MATIVLPQGQGQGPRMLHNAGIDQKDDVEEVNTIIFALLIYQITIIAIH